MVSEIDGQGENYPNNAKSHRFLVSEEGQKSRSHSGVAAVHNEDQEDGSEEEIVHWTKQFASFEPAWWLDFSGPACVLTHWRPRGYPYPPAPISALGQEILR